MFVMDIHHEKFDAVVSSKGAQILSWKPKNQEDVFWSCDKKFYKTQLLFVVEFRFVGLGLGSKMVFLMDSQEMQYGIWINMKSLKILY